VDDSASPRALETRKQKRQSSVTCAAKLNHFSKANTGRVLRRRTRLPQTSMELSKGLVAIDWMG